MPDQPLISCLMVTMASPSRFARLKASVADYARQSWPRRELVLVLNGGDPGVAVAIRAHVASLGRDDIRIIEPPGALPLGALRNISRTTARGEVFCQWDDDDLYHPQRLARQAEALMASGGEAVCLEQVMQFFAARRRLYCTRFRGTDDGVFAGSLMCRSRAPIHYPETGAEARLGEDSAVVTQLRRRQTLHAQDDAPHLYVYVSHGANAWGAEHHLDLAEGRGLSQGLLRRREAALRRDLAPLDFGPGVVTVQGHNGPAFELGR